MIQMGNRKPPKKSSAWRRAKRRLGDVALTAWFLAFAYSFYLFMADGEWRGFFWCGYALYAAFIFAI